MNEHPVITTAQLAAMNEAERRSPGDVWKGDARAAEECCTKGWLVAGLRLGSIPGADDSVAYSLTVLGREINAGRAGVG